MAKYEAHDFYCLNCGRKGLPCQRKMGQQREQFHRKKLHCIFCNLSVNHMEIRNQEEKEYFMEAFENGDFKEEAEESIRCCGDTGIR